MSRSFNDFNLNQEMKNAREVLYVGNIFSKHGQGVTVIETLGVCLEERYVMHYASGLRSRIARFLHMLISVVRLRKRVSVVLIDTYSTLNFFYALAVSQICRLLGVPYIPILHGGNLPARLTKSPRASRSIFQHCRINVAPSEYLRREFSGRGYSVVCIPNSISLADYPFRRRNSCEPKLLYVRAFAALYNPEMAIQTLGHLIKRYPNAELCMVGPDRDGTLSRCRQLAEKLGLSERVTFIGQLGKSEWHRLSESYDIFLNTSDFDNMPVSVVEAMALGLPVISTDPGGMPDLVESGRNGLLVNRGDAESMAERIGYLIEQPQEACRLAENARKKIAYLDWQIVKKQWAGLLG